MPDSNVLNPYRGLRPYSAVDAPTFYGRVRLVQRLVQQLLARPRPGVRFLSVLGPSGSGKTSLVQAGLWPELRRQDAASALFTIEHPSLDPFEQLTRQGMARAAEDLGAALATVGRIRGGRPVLVLDHAEELIVNPHGFAQKSLIEQLTRLCSAPAGAGTASEDWGDATLILVLRTDCLAGFAAVAPELTPIVEQSSAYVSATLELQEWMSIVREPPRALGIQVEPGVLAAIAHDLGDLESQIRERQRTSGVLPLLSFALTRLWEKRSGAMLRVADYQAIGGIKEAIRRWADVSWSAVPNKASSRRSLLTLMEAPSQVPNGQLMTRPRPLSEWRAGEASASSSTEASSVAGLVSLFSTGLLHLNEEQDSVELAHSVLLEEWPALAAMYGDEQRFQGWHRDMVEISLPASDPGTSRAPTSAMSIYRLAEAERWLVERPTEIDGAVRRYIERSRAQQERLRGIPPDRLLGSSLALGLLSAFLLLGLIGEWYWQQREQQRMDLELASERGARAGVMALLPGQDSAALALAIKAVAPTLRSGHTVPSSAKDGLMTAYSLAKNSLPLHGHSDRVDVAIFDPSGQHVLTGSTDRTARIWDARTGKLLLTLSGHRAMLTSVSYSPDGTRALTTSVDHTARLWDARSGTLLYELLGHSDVIEAGGFSPDGTRAITAGHDHIARVWDVHAGRLVHTLKGHSDRVTAAAFSRDGRYMLTASWDHTARLWDCESGNLVRVLEGHTNRLNVAAFAPDGQHVATGGWDETVRLWDLKTFEPVILPHGTRLHGMSFSPDSRWLATTGTDGVIKLWDGQNGQFRAKLSGHNGIIDALDFAPDSVHFVTGGADRMVRLWDVRVERPVATLYGHDGQIYTAAFSPTGSRVVTSSYDQTARIWDVRAGQPLAILKGHDRGLTSASFSPDGTRIVTSSDDQTARLWRWPGGAQIAVLSGHRHAVQHATFSTSGNLIATCSSDYDVRLWDGHTGEQVRLLSGHQGPVYFVAFSPDDSLLVSSGVEHTLRLWDPQTGALRSEVPGHRGNAVWMAFSPDGKYLLTAGSEGEVWLRNGRTAAPLRQLLGHSARVHRAEFFRANGELRLITASSDRTVRIWDPEKGAVLSTLQTFADDVVSVSLSPDGRRLLIVSRDQGVRLWDVAAEMPLAVIPDYAEEMISAAYAPPDGRYFLIASGDGTTKVYVDDYPANLAGTLSDACDHLRYQRDFERVQSDCPTPN